MYATHRRARQLVLPAVVVLGSLAFGCSPDATSGEPPTAPIRLAAASVELSPDARARIAETRRNVAWVGKLHNDAMVEAMRESAQWGPSVSDRDERTCAIALRLAVKYGARARLATGRSADPGADFLSARRALAANPRCAAVPAMSVFPRSNQFRHFSNLLIHRAEAPAWDPYANAILQATEAWDGYYGLESTVNNVVAEASGLPQADFDVVVALADLIGSSVDTWYYYQQQGAFGTAEMEVEPTSIFRGYRTVWPAPFGLRCNARCRALALIDGIGCAAGAVAGGGIVGCLVGGIGGSAASAIEVPQ